MFKWERSTLAPIAQGKSGKIYKVYCASEGTGFRGEYIQKQFNKDKSSKTFLKELDCQRRAAEVGVAPIIRDFSTINKNGSFIVMDKCSCTLLDLIKEQKGLYVDQLSQIESLYKRLDKIGIQHNDANIGNVMVNYDSNGIQFQLIDFGMGTTIMGKQNDTSWKLLRHRIQREVNANT